MDTGLVTFYLFGISAIFVTACLVYLLGLRYSLKLNSAVLFTVIIGSLYIPVAQYLKYQSLHMYVDFAHWLQILQNIVTQGQPLAFSQEFIVPGTLNYFAAHFVPFVYLFSIPFKLIPQPETLVVLNVSLMLSAAIPLYKLAFRMRGDRYFALFAATFLLWYPTFQYITLYEFEMLRFSIPILLWMLYFFEARRTAPYLLFVVLAILVREEVGLTVTMFGVYALFFAKRRKEGLVAVLAGLVGFWLITSRLMPLFSTASTYEHIAAGAFLPFGTTFPEILAGVARHPILALQTAFHPVKIANIFMLGLPLLFVPLLAPAALIGAFANIGTGLLSNSLVHSSYMLYYIAPSVPFIFYALLKAWQKITTVSVGSEEAWRSLQSNGHSERKRGISSPWYANVKRFLASFEITETALMNALLTALLVSNIFFGPSPISLQFWFKNIRPAPFRTQNFHWSIYRVTDHHRKIEKFVRMIPDDGIISTQQFLQSRLYKKGGTVVFPQLESSNGIFKAEYVLLDITNNALHQQSPAYVTDHEMAMVRENNAWELIAQEDGYELYRRKLHIGN